MIGALRHRVRIEQSTETIDDAGQTTSAWTEVVTLPCSVEAVVATENIVAQQAANPVVYRFRARYDARVHPNMRAVFDGANYDIIGITPMDNVPSWMRLECTRVL